MEDHNHKSPFLTEPFLVRIGRQLLNSVEFGFFSKDHYYLLFIELFVYNRGH